MMRPMNKLDLGHEMSLRTLSPKVVVQRGRAPVVMLGFE